MTPVISNIWLKFLSWLLCNLFHLVTIVEFTFYGQGWERILSLRLIWSFTHVCHSFKYQQEHSAPVGTIAELTSIQIKLKNICCDYCKYFNKFWKFSCGLRSSLVYFQKTCMSLIYACSTEILVRKVCNVLKTLTFLQKSPCELIKVCPCVHIKKKEIYRHLQNTDFNF